jgi:hypothetical protein
MITLYSRLPSAWGHNRLFLKNPAVPSPMLYAVLCYSLKDVAGAWSLDEDHAVMAKLDVVHRKLAKAGKFGPAVRLMPTTAGAALSKAEDPPQLIDGPFTDCKEQLLDFYVIDFADLDEAIEATRELARANPGGAYEIRPIRSFLPGSLPE